MSKSVVGHMATVTVKDAEGNVVFEGIVHSYSMRVRSGQIEMLGAYPTFDTVAMSQTEFSINGIITTKETAEEPKKHDHEWKFYDGFMEKYHYCDCGEKKK